MQSNQKISCFQSRRSQKVQLTQSAKSCLKFAKLCSNKLSQGGSIGGFLTLRSNTDATYMQSLCSNDFSTVYPARYLVLFQEDIHDTAYRIFSAAMICLPFSFAHAQMIRFQFIRHLRQSEIVEENINFCRSISRLIFLVFLSTSAALNILSLYQLSLDFETFPMCLFGHFRFWTSTCFPEVICPRYVAGGIIFPI